MSAFELYVHGTPNGHQIWGSEKNHDYISTFYNHDSNITDNAALQIDICLGDSYYTYLHQQDVYDSNERPGSFFAMTVCFSKSYCTNVSKLYQIFEAVYEQICVGTLITLKQNKEVFLVSDFESSRSGNNATVDKIRAIFVKNIAELIQPFIIPLVNVPDTFNKTKKQFSLKEVDSPLFFDFFKKQSIVISPNIEPAAIANQIIAKQLNTAITQKKALETANSQLQTDNARLLNENKELSSQLQASASSSEKKYSSTITQLKSELRIATQERDELKAKIEDAKSSIELIDKPVQKLTRLLAGRFPESDKKHIEEDLESSQKCYSKVTKGIWTSGLNSILLGIIIALCFVIIYFVALKPSIVDNTSKGDEIIEPADSVVTTYYSYEGYGAGDGENASEEEIESGEPAIKYDDWESCRINIIGGSDQIENGKTYTLKVQKKDFSKATVPQGFWSVWINSPNEPINNDNSFVLPEGTALNTNVRVEYIVDGKAVLSRTPKVIK